MKVFFNCSARGIKDFGEIYKKIHQEIIAQGHTIIGDYLYGNSAADIYSAEYEERIKFYKETMKNLKRADVVVLEVSTHSLSMGYLMQSALAMGKPVIALHLSGKGPAFASGIDDEKLQVIEYAEDQVGETLSAALDYAEGISDVRFNFFISPAIGVYLDWISKHKKIPRSVFLRTLIERDMAENEEYHAD